MCWLPSYLHWPPAFGFLSRQNSYSNIGTVVVHVPCCFINFLVLTVNTKTRKKIKSKNLKQTTHIFVPQQLRDINCRLKLKILWDQMFVVCGLVDVKLRYFFFRLNFSYYELCLVLCESVMSSFHFILFGRNFELELI